MKYECERPIVQMPKVGAPGVPPFKNPRVAYPVQPLNIDTGL